MFKAQRLSYHSTLVSRVFKEKKMMKQLYSPVALSRPLPSALVGKCLLYGFGVRV